MRKIAIILIAFGLFCGIAYSCIPKSIFPIDENKVQTISFDIYPQDLPVYTITNQERIMEIVSAINELDRNHSGMGPNHVGDYYLITLKFDDGEQQLVEFDENGFFYGKEYYVTDTMEIRALLERTYHDRHGKIE